MNPETGELEWRSIWKTTPEMLGQYGIGIEGFFDLYAGEERVLQHIQIQARAYKYLTRGSQVADCGGNDSCLAVFCGTEGTAR